MALVALLLAPAAYAAPDSASCLVRIIHAKHEGNTFDPRLEPLKKQLTSGPLSVWKSYNLLSQHDLLIHVGSEPTSFEVPGNHQGKLDFLGQAEAQGQKGPRLRLRLQIIDGQAKLLNTTFLLNNAGTLLLGGIEYEGGKIVLGITCKLSS